MPHSCLPWLIGDDLNEILYNYEKQGGPQKSQAVLEVFKTTLEACDLYDLGYSGHKFTWWNGQSRDASVEEILDWFCASSEWSALFPLAKLMHIDNDMS